ncbi:MAG: DNA methyltransferase [Pseudomonadota bacterium]
MQQHDTIGPSQYQLLPPLSSEQYAALKADIAKRGVLVPVEVDESGNILDGHHRIQAWQELRREGIKVPNYERLIRAGLTEPEKRNHVRALNLLRRHLSRDELREQMVQMRQDGATLAEIAKATGVDTSTVQRQLASDSQFANAKSEVVNARGQARPSHYAPRKTPSGFARNEREQAKVTQALVNAGDSALNKTITPSEAREASNHPANVLTPNTSGTPTPGAMLRLGRFQDCLADIPDASVDLIFTDPPYVKTFLPQWSDLSLLAARILKPGGMLVAYSGQTYLPEVIARLSEHLQYWWLGAIWHGGSSGMVLADQPVRKIVNVWKPLLFFVPAGFVQGETIRDGVLGEGSEKDAHGWQQGLAEALFYVGLLCPAGGLVVDPCMGGGTTGVAAVRLARQFIGVEANLDAYLKSTERIEREREACAARIATAGSVEASPQGPG